MVNTLKWGDICTESSPQALHWGSAHYPAGYRFQAHSHDFAEFFIVLDGSGIHHCDGIHTVLKKSSCCFIHPDCEHAIEAAADSSMLILNIAMNRERWTSLYTVYFSQSQDWLWSRSQSRQVHQITSGDRQLFAQKTQKAQQFQADQQLQYQAPSRLTEDALILHLLGTLSIPNGSEVNKPSSRNISATDYTSTVGNNAPTWLTNTIHTITEEHCFHNAMSRMQDISGKSREHIHRSIRKHYQHSASEYINSLRIDYAAKRLQESNDSILSIGLDCGFESQPHFFRTFKKIHACTPRQYRIRHKTI